MCRVVALLGGPWRLLGRPGAPGGPQEGPRRAQEGPRKDPGGQETCIFTCVFGSAPFSAFFDRSKDIVKHVVRLPGALKSFGAAALLDGRPRSNAAFLSPGAPEPNNYRVVLAGSWPVLALKPASRNYEPPETPHGFWGKVGLGHRSMW